MSDKLTDTSGNIKAFIDAVNTFARHSTYETGGTGYCMFCDKERPNHRRDCEWEITEQDMLRKQHVLAKEYGLGMYAKK